jgi:hypothetical protein
MVIIVIIGIRMAHMLVILITGDIMDIIGDAPTGTIAGTTILIGGVIPMEVAEDGTMEVDGLDMEADGVQLATEILE